MVEKMVERIIFELRPVLLRMKLAEQTSAKGETKRQKEPENV